MHFYGLSACVWSAVVDYRIEVTLVTILILKAIDST